jgi:hypothetical protein
MEGLDFAGIYYDFASSSTTSHLAPVGCPIAIILSAVEKLSPGVAVMADNFIAYNNYPRSLGCVLFFYPIEQYAIVLFFVFNLCAGKSAKTDQQ